MQNSRDVLTPDALSMLQTIAETGSFAAAARKLVMVPSALSYRVRQIEDALDVLLFDRSSRQARMTPAGLELLQEGRRLLEEIDAVAHRVKRVATGWEPQLTIAVDTILVPATIMELCAGFLALAPPTRIRLRDEVLSGTLEALTSGQADLALGTADTSNSADIQTRPLGEIRFVFAVAPHHPLATATEPLSDSQIQQHRAIAVADTISRGKGITIGLLGGQDVFTVPSMAAKLDGQLRGLGVGFLPETMAQPWIESGRLVVKRTERPTRKNQIHYAWRTTAQARMGRGLQWWLAQLESPLTRTALLRGQKVLAADSPQVGEWG